MSASASDCVGNAAEIHGLNSHARLNGKTGQITGYVNNERWKVMVNGKVYAIKPDNLWKIQACHLPFLTFPYFAFPFLSFPYPFFPYLSIPLT